MKNRCVKGYEVRKTCYLLGHAWVVHTERNEGTEMSNTINNKQTQQRQKRTDVMLNTWNSPKAWTSRSTTLKILMMSKKKFQWFWGKKGGGKCDDQQVFLPLVPVLNIPSFRFLVSMCFYELIPRVSRPLGESSWSVSVWGAERESVRTEAPRYLWPSLHHASRARSLLPGRRPCDSTYTLQLYKVWSVDILVHYNTK